jgi:excisionase family DNA binding protein
MNALLKPSELARLMGVTPRTVRAWVDKGWVKALRTPGGKYRIPAAEALKVLGRGQGETNG